MQEAVRHLKKDKILRGVIKNFPIPVLKKGSKYFSALVRSIIYQQLSGASARSIERKFLLLFKKDKLTPENLLKLKDEQFKSSGISPQKMRYLRDLALRFQDGTINPKNFHRMSDDEIVEHLVVVKGVGVWTAHMFLMFTLNRFDVLPTGDLGIQKGFKFVFNLRNLPSEKQMHKFAEKWKPYRTIASMYLWRVADSKK